MGLFMEMKLSTVTLQQAGYVNYFELPMFLRNIGQIYNFKFMPSANATTKEHLHLHLLVLIWGFTSILGVFITIPSVELVFYRTLLACLMLGAILFYKKIPMNLPRAELLQLIGTGGLIAIHWILFFAAARVSNVSTCLAGIATSSLWTSLLEPLITRRKFSWFEMVTGVVVMSGLYVIFYYEFDKALGLVMGIFSALFATLFSIMNGKFTKKHQHQVITFYEMMGALISIILFLPAYMYWFSTNGELQLAPTTTDWLCIFLLAGVCTVYAYAAAVDLMKKFSAFAMNLTINLEPVYGIVLAFLIFGEKEQMTPGFYIGTMIILTSVLSYPAIDRKLRKRGLLGRTI